MGQTPTGGEEQEHWELQAMGGEGEVYLNIRNQRMYIRSSMVLGDLGDMQYELDIYNFRRINEAYVVSVDYCSNSTQPEMCSSVTALTYYIEKQEYTLFHLHHLPFQQALNVFLHALQAFKILYEKFGYFAPNSKLIFFNYLHQVRVWISEDLKITKNTQNRHGAKNLSLENTFLREIVHLFDSIRDPHMPALRFSQFLPNQPPLTFQTVHEIFFKKSIEVTCMRQPQNRVFAQIKNVSPPPQIPLQLKKNTLSYQNSPMNSPRVRSPFHQRKDSALTMNFTYRSPLKKTQTYPPPYLSHQPMDFEHQQMKQATKMSLKNASSPTKACSFLQPREFTSTMPNSIHNSGVYQKNVIIQKLDPTPMVSRDSSITKLKEEKKLLKEAAHRYSEAQEHMMTFACRPKKTKVLKVSLEQNAKLNFDKMDKQSDTAIYDEQLEQQKECTEFVERGKHPSGPNFMEPHRRQFQTHKRHQTDFKMPNKMRSSGQSQVNQVSMMDGNNLSKFRLNTIKSIHLLDEDKEYDRQIIVDLKQIINKYRKLA